MTIFFTLLFKLIPLYLIIILGYWLGRFYKINRETIARILIYIVVPIVVFNGIFQAEISLSTLSLPLLAFVVGSILCFVFYQIAKTIWPGAEKNIIAFTAGTGNTGYLGLPVAIILFGDAIVPYAILFGLGTVFYENTFGLFVLGKGHYSSKDSLKNLLKLPTIYACLLGFIAHLFHFHLGSGYTMLVSNFQGCYVVLGMLLIGLGISEMRKIEFDFQFTSVAFAVKFLGWPLLSWVAVNVINHFVPNFYASSIYNVILVLSLVPLAANTVVYTTALNMHPERTALTVLLSTVWALFYIPLMLQFILK